MATKKEKNQQIQVFVRVRPFDASKEPRSNTCVEVTHPKEINVRCLNSKKKFTFDKAFGPNCSQLEVYQSVVNPLIKEVLDGYNCTVFAYGQTGTGKTHTMIGGHQNSTLSWQNDLEAGIIPRALGQLFDELRLAGSEYTVRVSYLELYNEELFDLLSETNDNSKIRLYEDPVKKGSVIAQGLEEVLVQSKTEVYKILERGSKKRQTATTLLNANSSRSHTIFSITIHMKESTVDGEDLLKMGKLNLVDLAGSENIGRSGVIEKRAREAGNINQSLLTLGRVITALTERTPHIPYRESKLTRLLQDSLGGHTKTSIIATVSPSTSNLDETISTLEYANRAKNITNRPETNQRFTKSVLIKQYTDEIKRLREDLIAARTCNGIYIAPDNYDSMIADMKSYQTQLNEKINDCCALTEELARIEQIMTDLKMALTATNNKLFITEESLNETKIKCEEKEYVIEKYAETENKLIEKANKILAAAKEASEDSYKLHDSLLRRKTMEEKNVSQASVFINNYNENMSIIDGIVSQYINEKRNQSQQFLHNIFNHQNFNEAFIKKEVEKIKALTASINDAGIVKKENDQEFSKTSSSMNVASKDSLVEFATNLLEKLKIFEQQAKSMENSLSQHIKSNDENVQKFQVFLGQTFTEFEETYTKLYTQCEEKFIKLNEHLIADNEKMKILLEKYDTNEKKKLKARNELLKQIKNLESLEKESRNNLETFCEAHESLQNETKEMHVIISNEMKSFGGENQTKICETVKNIDEYIAQDSKNIEVIKANISNACHKIEENCTSIAENVELHKNEISEKVLLLQEIIDRKMKNDNQHVEKYLDINSEMSHYIDEIQNHDISSQQIYKNIIETNCQSENEHVNQFEQNLKEQCEKSKDHLQQFFTVDIKLQYTPTGLTPLRKVFQYPTKLEKTSPQPRLISRFHQLRSSNKQSLNSSNESNESSFNSSSPDDTADFGKSNRCNINKSASMSNLPEEHSSKHESLQNNGKENMSKLQKSSSEKTCF